jgi:hypothetical protein
MLELEMIVWSSTCEVNARAVLKLQQLFSVVYALLYSWLNLLISGSVICAGGSEPLAQAEIVTELWDILGTGSGTDDASD